MPGSVSSLRLARDGLEIAYSEWGIPGEEPLVVLVHATGFCKEVCEPIVDDLDTLRQGVHAVALDQRGHGDSGAPEPPFTWWDNGADVLEVIEESRPVIGVGHSAGGAALLMAEILAPGTFSGFVLVEPIVFPPPYGRFPDNPMSNAARRRRDTFASRQEALDNWKSKAVFSGWDDRALRSYVNGGLRSDGDRLVLKCSREAEAETFAAATEHRAWERLGEVAVETLIVAGEHSTTHRQPFVEAIVDRMPMARYEIIPDTSHMVWMERPGIIAERVLEFL